jgi:GT2 family glycosyltransferase
VQATAIFDGHAGGIHTAGPTASAGAAMAVDRRKFVELGGFDPLYLPGRIEDLDFSLRGYLAGYHARYVPQAIAYHRGMATFGRAFGAAGCDHLALRNTLLFQWKNLRHPAGLLRQAAALPIRLAWDVARLPLVPRRRRLAFARALFGAIRRLPRIQPMSGRGPQTRRRERLFFQRFHPRRMTPPHASNPPDRAMPHDIFLAPPFAGTHR